jgi:hypothetical protein
MRRLILTMLLVGTLLATQLGVAYADVTQVNVELTSGTLLDPAHVLVEGTVTCDSPTDFGFVEVALRQRGGIFGFREGFGAAGVPACGTDPTPLSIIVTGGPFHPGSAFFDVSALVCDPTFQCASSRTLGTVRITR